MDRPETGSPQATNDTIRVSGSVVMAHVPLDQQTTDGPRSILHHAVGTAVGHQGGLRLYNPKTKRVIIRYTYKILGPTPQPHSHPEYEIRVDITAVSDDVNDYKYLIGTLHRDFDYELEAFKTVDVLVETFDETEDPVIVAYRRRASDIGRL